MATIFWMQCGACSGDSMSLLNTEEPDITELLTQYGAELLWHPSLSPSKPNDMLKLVNSISDGRQDLTILVVEGSVIHGPENTGMFDSHHGTSKKELIRKMAEQAYVVLAVGSCASYGGIPASRVNPTDSTGLQFTMTRPGGLFKEDWRSRSGFPVINLPGCPIHPGVFTDTVISLLNDSEINLDSFNRPADHYSTIVHRGCTRNEHHEFDVEDDSFGGSGCLFYNLGCQGPYTQGRCNDELWNRRSSKTRAGVPCFGCTSPDFPKDRALFQTAKLGTVPVDLPLGVVRPNYMAYKGLARAATPARLLKDIT